jgi:hypothetical protein
VTRLHTNYALPPDVDVARLVHTEQQRLLMEESGLARSRPDAVIEFARPRGYPEMLEVIKAHGYDLARRLGGPSRLKRRSPPTGTTTSICRVLPRSIVPGSPLCIRSRQRPICSCGSTSVAAICGCSIATQTSTRPPRTPRVKASAAVIAVS